MLEFKVLLVVLVPLGEDMNYFWEVISIQSRFLA
jgi:hypothetical protein